MPYELTQSRESVVVVTRGDRVTGLTFCRIKFISDWQIENGVGFHTKDIATIPLPGYSDQHVEKMFAKQTTHQHLLSSTPISCVVCTASLLRHARELHALKQASLPRLSLRFASVNMELPNRRSVAPFVRSWTDITHLSVKTKRAWRTFLLS